MLDTTNSNPQSVSRQDQPLTVEEAKRRLAGKASPFGTPPNPVTVYEIQRGWNDNWANTTWKFVAQGTVIAVLEQADSSHDDLIALMLKAWPFLADLPRNKGANIYPRACIEWTPNTAKANQRIVTAIKVLPVSKGDMERYHMQELSWAARQGKLADHEVFAIYKKHIAGSADRATAFKAAMEAIESMSKPKPQNDEYQPTSTAGPLLSGVKSDPDGFKAAFPLDKNNQPVEDEMSKSWEQLEDEQKADQEPPVDELTGENDAKPKHWMDDEEKRKQTFAWINGHFNERQAPTGDWRKEWLAWWVNKQRDISSNHIHDYPGTFAEFQKEGFTVIQRYDTARQHCIKLLDDADLKPGVATWREIFNHDRFWDTVASGKSDMEIIKAVEDFVTHNANTPQNAPKNDETPTTGATTPEPPPTTSSEPDNARYHSDVQKLPPVQSKSTNGVKPVNQPIKLDEPAIRAKYTKKLQGGKEYLEVAGRVLLFRIDHPAESGWGIETDLLHADDKGAVFKARILNPTGSVVATGHARATFEKSNNYSGRVFEKAETAALGRALANAGYGTDDIDETEEPAHLADSPRSAA